MNKKSLYLGLLITLVIAIGLTFYLIGHKKAPLGQAISPTDGSATNFTEITASTGAQLGSLYIGGTTANTSIGEQVSTGGCTSATSTIFAVQNPFAATSTATIQLFSGVGNATTTLLTVGTSTIPIVLAATVSPSFANAMSIATSSQFAFSSGITVGSIGYTSPGVNSFRTISVGPLDYVSAFATTTTTNMSINYSPTFSSCVYKISWKN